MLIAFIYDGLVLGFFFLRDFCIHARVVVTGRGCIEWVSEFVYLLREGICLFFSVFRFVSVSFFLILTNNSLV